ncbi:MAG: ATP-dependent zinc metalloprotease FtsH, partial [Planctomycetota bacterium]|nr:ATP-dependent zinc metalloprotease FtsH [Planctomycetota bacterium]
SPTPVSQDQLWWRLWNGSIASLEIRGDNEVLATNLLGERLVTSFTDAGAVEADLRAAKAAGSPLPITEEELRIALEQGYLEVDAHRHLTSRERQVTEERDPQTGQARPKVTDVQQRDLLLVEGTARPKGQWTGLVERWQSAGELPRDGGRVVLKVDPLRDLPDLKADLVAAGSLGQDLSFDLSKSGGTKHGQADTTLGSILLYWGPPILIFFFFMMIMRQMRNQGGGAGVMQFGRSRAQMYSKENHTGVTFEDVAGAQEAKEEVREIVEFLKNPQRFTQIGGRIPRGVLLTGPPGCGKTLLAKAIAGEAEVPFFSISGSDFVEMFVGVGASRVRDLFKQARESSPCIIFLDEIDAVGRRRGSGMGGGHDEREQTLNAILVEMDGFGTDEGIIVVAATNRPDVLDPALLRPGRFDREVAIDLPDLEGRKQILGVHLKKVKVADGLDVKSLARSTPGYSGADLAAIVNEAAIMAVLERCEQIEMHHLEEATAKVRYGRKKTSQKIEEEDLEITAYHEAGHTIVAAKDGRVDVPHKVTIVPRGRSLGATMMLPEKESYHMQRERLLGQLAIFFGGRVAEDLFVGDISAGASDDIKRATELARAMVTELGMSEKVGPINYAERQGSDFLGTELMASKWHSEETARVIDKEIERILREAYVQAEEIIKAERPAVERLTKALLLYETLDQVEIQRLVEGTAPEDLRPEKPEKKQGTPASQRPVVSDPGAEEDLGGLSGEVGLSPA